jgi:hypothetical protein
VVGQSLNSAIGWHRLKYVPEVQLKTEQKSNEVSAACPKYCEQLVGMRPVCKSMPAVQTKTSARNRFFVLDILKTP